MFFLNVRRLWPHSSSRASPWASRVVVDDVVGGACQLAPDCLLCCDATLVAVDDGAFLLVDNAVCYCKSSVAQHCSGRCLGWLACSQRNVDAVAVRERCWRACRCHATTSTSTGEAHGRQRTRTSEYDAYSAGRSCHRQAAKSLGADREATLGICRRNDLHTLASRATEV